MSIHDASMYVHDMIVYSFQFHVCYIIMNHYRIYTVYIYMFVLSIYYDIHELYKYIECRSMVFLLDYVAHT